MSAAVSLAVPPDVIFEGRSKWLDLLIPTKSRVAAVAKKPANLTSFMVVVYVKTTGVCLSADCTPTALLLQNFIVDLD